MNAGWCLARVVSLAVVEMLVMEQEKVSRPYEYIIPAQQDEKARNESKRGKMNVETHFYYLSG